MTKITTKPGSGSTQFAFQVFTVMLCLVFLSGCYFPSSISPDSRIFDSVSDFSMPPVNVQFQLALPEPATSGERIVVEILDDVTGLPYNSRVYELKQLSDRVYETTLSVPSGSVIKYRYGKIGQPITLESTVDGNPVDYRLLYAPISITVQDHLQAWQGEPYIGGTGRFKGMLVDSSTNLPIADIIVSAGGLRTFTDFNGKFVLEGLGEGVHNVVFYAIDGKYRTYQQGASIQSGMTTPANVSLVPMPEVSVTFLITPPGDALGAPIYVAGNIYQLGNTFAELTGMVRIKPNRMPMLAANSDGTLSITLKLYAETDLRYKFTLGDGYWNAEQYESGGFRVRQLIVPTQDATITHVIETWRSPDVEPITFSISIPSQIAPVDGKYIQFRIGDWMEPLPLWPLGNGNYLYILFSPLNPSQAIAYQFCRNEDCARARDAGSLSFERQVQPAETPQTITLTLDRWQNWFPFEKNAMVDDAYIPVKPATYSTSIELIPDMSPSWLIHAPVGIAALDEIGADTIIFSPQWFVRQNSPYLHPEFGMTPFSVELISLMNTTQALGFGTGLFPNLGPYDSMENWWVSSPRTEAWLNVFFESYHDYIISYAKLAQRIEAEQLIIGGKNLLPAFEGGIYPDGTESALPISFDQHWLDLLREIREIYSGQLMWGTNANLSIDPLPDFIGEFDGIHISVDSPLALGDEPTFEMIQAGFIDVIDSQIYEVYRSTLMPITLALAYPAVEIAPSGCALLGESCYNDGLFRTSEILPYAISFSEQALIYNAIMPIIASRDWITGTSIRGYEPSIVVHDGASSIAGKPAFDVIQYWFNGMKP